MQQSRHLSSNEDFRQYVDEHDDKGEEFYKVAVPFLILINETPLVGIQLLRL